MSVAQKARARRQPRRPQPRPRIDRLIVATAGDEASLGAIHVAVELARRESVPVIAVAVMPPLPLVTYGSVAAPLLAGDESGRLELLEGMRAMVAGVPGTGHWEKRAIIGDVAQTINELARGDGLIIMGLSHHGRLDRLFSGETTVQVIRAARVPVLLVTPTARSLPRHVVAAIDFTDASMAAALMAADLLDDEGTLTLAHVDSFGAAKVGPGDLIDLYRAGVRSRLDGVVRRITRRTHRRIEIVFLHGEVADAVLAYAEKADCDMISLGGEELGFLDRLLLGSVRTKVVRNARCSVLIAPSHGPRGGVDQGPAVDDSTAT
jgi:nucleotide-binding universal stress UspA family protein